MDKQLTAKEQKQLLNALAKAKEMSRQLEAKEEEKRWSEIEVSLSLADGLGKLTKNELSTIRTSLGIKGASTLKKQELIGVLEHQIPVVLPELLNKMDETRFRILKQLADRGGHAFLPLESHQLDYFKNRGMIFSGTHKGKKTLVMPQEVLESLKKTNTPSYRETVRRNTEWIKLTHGMLYYYGTLSLNELENLMKHHTGENFILSNYLFILDESKTFYREIRLDKNGFSNIRVFDAERVKKEHQSRLDLSFYPFTKTQLLTAGEPGFIDRNPSYQAFVEFIRNNYMISRDAADSLVEECVYAIRIGEHPSNLLQFLQSQMEIDELEMLQAFLDHIALLNNNTKQWFIKGYTPYELSPNDKRKRQSLPPTKAEVVDFVTRKKVGRNNPCPCGSGKKFKKCCGG